MYAIPSTRGKEPGSNVEQTEKKPKWKFTRTEAADRLKKYIVRGILDDSFIAAFFSQIRKVPTRMEAPAAVTMTDNGVKLVYDIDFMAGASDDNIEFTLSHELMHVLNLHFLRGYELMEELQVAKSVFFSRYVPLADCPVNQQLNHMKGAQDEWKHLLTYDTLPNDVIPDSYPTFESVVHYMFENHPEDDSEYKVVLISDNGESRTLKDGEGTTVVIPDVTKEGEREHLEDIKELVDSAQKSAGNAPYGIQKAIEGFLDEYKDSVLKGWVLLQHFLTGYRNINKGRVRSLRRLNRRTGLIPGKITIKGFRALFIVDESGSMSDEEVKIALTLAKKAILRENSDKLFYIHWDTEPSGDVEEIRYESDIENIERKKCGGTEFSELFSHELVQKQDVDLIVVITDGYPCGWPATEPYVPHLWIITQEGGYKQWENDYGKGLAVCVEEDG